MSLNQKSVAVVTGAASGIGRALAVRLAQEKIAGIAIADVNEPELKETAALVEKTGVPVSAHLIDVSKLDEVQRLADEAVAKHGRVTHWINNAGVALVGNVAEVSLEDMQWLMGINFWGTVYGSKVFLSLLSGQETGHLINISSVFGFIAPPGQAAYCASKFAVRGFTESLRHELEGSNVLISCVHPGGIKTNICNDSRIGKNATDEDKKKVKKFFDKASPTTADEAAETIVNGIKNKKVRILIGSDARMIDKIQRWFPKKYFAVMNYMSGGALSAMMKK